MNLHLSNLWFSDFKCIRIHFKKTKDFCSLYWYYRIFSYSLRTALKYIYISYTEKFAFIFIYYFILYLSSFTTQSQTNCYTFLTIYFEILFKYRYMAIHANRHVFIFNSLLLYPKRFWLRQYIYKRMRRIKFLSGSIYILNRLNSQSVFHGHRGDFIRNTSFISNLSQCSFF